jgi:hypothetical protein
MFVQTLTPLVLAMILQEAPNVASNQALRDDFEADITQMISVHETVADGKLVDTSFDALLLSAVNYKENRMRLPAPDGDCGLRHKYSNLPSGQWPIGYRPVAKMTCNSAGPMQINKGSIYTLPIWAEVRQAFPERGWFDEKRGKLTGTDGFTKDELNDPMINVRISYAILQHWKNECVSRKGEVEPVGVWLTAYRYGKCPATNGHGQYYIDAEAKRRCKMAVDWAAALSADDDSTYAGAAVVDCTY